MSDKATIQEPGTAQSMAVWLSVIGMFSVAAGSLNVLRILGSQTPLRAALWLGLMLALTAAAVRGAKSRTAAVVWASTGGVLGFVVIASGSIGVFFAPAGLLLFAASVAMSVAERPRWRALWIPLWLAAGASGVAALTLLIFSMQGSVIQAPGFSQQTKLVPPAAVVWGSAVFLVVLVIMASRALMRLLESRIR